MRKQIGYVFSRKDKKITTIYRDSNNDSLLDNKINQFFEYLIQNKIKKGENQKNGEIR